MIIFNAVWIAVDTDNNDAALLIHALPVFQAMEMLGKTATNINTFISSVCCVSTVQYVWISAFNMAST